MALTVDVVDISKRYGRKWALQATSFRVEAGISVGLIGPNGAGKSTLLRTLLGLTRPSTGNVWFNRTPLWPHPEQAMSQVGGFVDLPRFYPYLTARENLSLLADLIGQSRRRVLEVLREVHLYEVQDQKAGGYSHGMRQRLGLAAALLKKPALIVLDEPHDGLDPARQEEMRCAIEAVRQDLSCTLIMSSHVMQDIERLCDRIAVFEAGRIRYFGGPGDLGRELDEEVLWEVWPVDLALTCLRGMGIWARVSGDGRVAAVWHGRPDLGDVNEVLMRKGLTIRTVVRQQMSLESRLLRYLGDGHVDVR